MKILVTGANGFIGKPLCAELHREGHAVVAVVRSANISIDDFERMMIGSMDDVTPWSIALSDVDVVVHLAARVHIMNDHAADPLAEFRKVNVAGTLNLARQAASAGVKRFIFVSSVKVNGETTVSGSSFKADDITNPSDAYGISKMEAELGLLEIGQQTGMEVVIVRPALVYGPGVKANFAAMIKFLKYGLPLPFGAVNKNRRSFVSIDNLIDFLLTCISHPAAANQIFMVSDGEDMSTAELLRRLGSAIGHPATLYNVPPRLLMMAAKLFGKKEVALRLLGNLQVDITKNEELLGWKPPVSVEEGFSRIVVG